jgi:hypothetical protein
MKLIKYNQFIKESTEVTDDLINVLIERGKFYDVISDIHPRTLLNSNYNYSDFCKKEDANPEEDFLKIQKFIESEGFSFNKLKDIFSKDWDKKCGYNLYDLYKGGDIYLDKDPFKSILNNIKSNYKLPLVDYNIIVSPFSFQSNLGDKNAAVDIYLYFLLKKLGVDGTIWLGGKGWGDLFGYDNGDESYSEQFIRYKYGYHQTEYGKLWMEQCKIDQDWLRESAKKCLQEYLSDNLIDIGYKLSNYKRNVTNLSFGDYVIIEEDRIIIDLKSLSDDINNSPPYNLSVPTLFLLEDKVNIENLSSYIIKDMSYFALDIELSDMGDLVIWSEFDENQQY